MKTQENVGRLSRDEHSRARKASLNVAHSGFFSSDRTIRQYGDEIWGAMP